MLLDYVLTAYIGLGTVYEEPLCEEAGGLCRHHRYCAHGARKEKGLCGGQSSLVQCCIPWQEEECRRIKGQCTFELLCDGYAVRGKYCPEQPSDVFDASRCCVTPEQFEQLNVPIHLLSKFSLRRHNFTKNLTTEYFPTARGNWWYIITTLVLVFFSGSLFFLAVQFLFKHIRKVIRRKDSFYEYPRKRAVRYLPDQPPPVHPHLSVEASKRSDETRPFIANNSQNPGTTEPAIEQKTNRETIYGEGSHNTGSSSGYFTNALPASGAKSKSEEE
ncbi:hypothetical protein DdX_19141 [Ditylenchus destructor]|uniref:Uncharacterized protein n=1 Tax=Ditylenchus destructor TaxID=166010 RepID=A0AAD4MIG2_9BILA|nr:hypothetical protein DdX_19141 [Ditylenchus destructor]